MSESEELPDLRSDPVIVGLQERVARAQLGFEYLNRGRRQEEPQYAPPPGAELESRTDALAALLIEAGLVDYYRFLCEGLTRQAEALERSLAGATEHKRRSTGLIVPPSANGSG